ncbi:MAG: hypothetical protein GXP31_09150 [Kiritimatiellaeota bacterium]|nr:hypothetical protein [Kiritimatiellota bacterium]
MRTPWKAMMVGMLCILSVGIATAQQPQQGGRKRPGGGPGMMRPPMKGGAMRGMMFLQRFDTNHDFQIQEEELRTGLEKAAADLAKVHGILLQIFDENKNGTLDPKENKKVGEFLMVIMSSRMLDTNHDWQISEDELGQAWDKLAEQCQRYNDFVLKRFDKDQDGKLSEEEIKAAREHMRRRRPGGGRPGGPGAGRGPKRDR